MARLQAPQQQCGQLGAIALFGHSQGDPAGGGRGHGLHDAGRLARRHTGPPDRAAHLPDCARTAGDLHGVQAILLDQRISQHRVVHCHPQHAPTHIATRQQCIKNKGLVRAMEGPQAQVHHTRRAAAWVGRDKRF